MKTLSGLSAILLLAGLSLGNGAGAPVGGGSGPAAFARMRELAGQWQGSYEWSGARNGSGKMSVSYRLTGNGSALVEDLSNDGVPTMTSVYHLDGDDLRMTHYCGAQNQPRLKADRVDLSRGTMHFSFVDATGMASPVAPHVSGVELQLVDAGHMNLSFEFLAGERLSLERIVLARVDDADSPRHR